MTKAQKPAPIKQSPGTQEAHLEDSIAQATDVVRKKLTQYSVHIVVVVALIFGVLGISSFIESSSRARVAELNGEFYEAFTKRIQEGKTDAEVRAATSAVLQRLLSENCAPPMVAQYVAWLFEKNGEGFRAEAWQLLDDARAKHKNDPFLKNFELQHQAARQPFTVPAPAPKPEVAKPAEAPVGEVKPTPEATPSPGVTPPAVPPPEEGAAAPKTGGN
ncbi:MAG: hypothetical protein ACKVX7_19580 [Planctomycetota bacterium]